MILLDCMLEVCHDKIKHEISRYKFLSVISDETTDVIVFFFFLFFSFSDAACRGL